MRRRGAELRRDDGDVVDVALLAAAGFVDVEVETATVTRKAERAYPIFLATARVGERR